MFPERMPQRRQESRNEGCEIEVKRSKNGSTKTRFRGKCSKEMVEYAQQQSADLPQGGSKVVRDFD